MSVASKAHCLVVSLASFLAASATAATHFPNQQPTPPQHTHPTDIPRSPVVTVRMPIPAANEQEAAQVVELVLKGRLRL